MSGGRRTGPPRGVNPRVQRLMRLIDVEPWSTTVELARALRCTEGWVRRTVGVLETVGLLETRGQPGALCVRRRPGVA